MNRPAKWPRRILAFMALATLCVIGLRAAFGPEIPATNVQVLDFIVPTFSMLVGYYKHLTSKTDAPSTA